MSRVEPTCKKGKSFLRTFFLRTFSETDWNLLKPLESTYSRCERGGAKWKTRICPWIQGTLTKKEHSDLENPDQCREWMRETVLWKIQSSVGEKPWLLKCAFGKGQCSGKSRPVYIGGPRYVEQKGKQCSGKSRAVRMWRKKHECDQRFQGNSNSDPIDWCQLNINQCSITNHSLQTNALDYPKHLRPTPLAGK